MNILMKFDSGILGKDGLLKLVIGVLVDKDKLLVV